MKRHALLRFCSLLLIFCFCCALFACETDEKTELETLYEKYVVSAEASGKTPYSYEEWLTRLASDNLTDAREYTVTFQPNNGEPAFTKTVLHGEAIEFPDAPKKSGYVFAGWAVETEESTQLWNSFYAATSDITLTAQWDYFSEELPIINIDTKDVSIDSKENYTDMTFTLENCDGELSEITGGIRLRGNTTMHYPKKPYRIKFDEKQSLFGLEKAKSWVLLAEYLDPSALHNYTAFSLASELSGLSFTPTPHKVNVYLNGTFIGLYTLCEQVQENKGRMDIEMDDDITEDMTDLKDFNFFICMDHSATGDPTAVLDETYYYIPEYDKYFELKYPEKADFASEEQFETFLTQLKAYTKEMLDAFSEGDTEKIDREVNLDSLIDYAIIDQIMGEQDHKWKSFNMYYMAESSDPSRSGKLSFGPIWDYDWSLYTEWTGTPNEHYTISEEITYSNEFFQALAKDPTYFARLKERYTLYASEILEKYIDDFDDLADSMEESVKANDELWYSELDKDLSSKNITFLKDFLKKRKDVLDEAWSTP